MLPIIERDDRLPIDAKLEQFALTVLDDAGLSYLLTEECPYGTAMDVVCAFYKYSVDYNKQEPFMAFISALHSRAQFKPAPNGVTIDGHAEIIYEQLQVGEPKYRLMLKYIDMNLLYSDATYGLPDYEIERINMVADKVLGKFAIYNQEYPEIDQCIIHKANSPQKKYEIDCLKRNGLYVEVEGGRYGDFLRIHPLSWREQ